ncbi:MAG: exosortase Q [Burkholderiaceae bacterium]|jgi:exosortase/archaeosortase family protein|nr:exosortase Q [Burkholderiaceae bacterium]
MKTAAYPLLRPGLLPWAIRLDRAPAWLWIGLQTAALWPAWRWMAARVADGSDDPLGLLALAALGVLLWSLRQQLRCAPRLSWLAAALAGTFGATLLRGPAAPLAASLLAIVAWACGLLAFLPDARRGAMRVRDGVLWPAPSHAIAAAPVLGLAVLALPLLASLQFYAGYPLRVLTAEASRWLLAVGFAVQREGASLLVDGQLIIVDAPCSGVQMAWAGYFTACAAALLKGRADRAFLQRLPLAGLMVLAGNVLRNTALVALQAGGRGGGEWAHQIIGLLALAAVCGGIAALMGWADKTSFRHSREGGNPKTSLEKPTSQWIPALAGMTKKGIGVEK